MSEVVLPAAPRLLHRQRVLLSLGYVRAFGGEMRDCDFQRLLFDYSRRCRERGVDAPYDFVAQEHGPRSFTAAADRDRLARHGILASGAWHLTAEGRRLAGAGSELKNRDVAVLRGSSGNRGEATLLEPMEIAKRPSAVTIAAKFPKTAAARMAAFSQRSATKDEATRPTSTSCLGRESLVSAMSARTRSVASGDSRSDFSPKAARNLVSGMSPFHN